MGSQSSGNRCALIGALLGFVGCLASPDAGVKAGLISKSGPPGAPQRGPAHEQVINRKADSARESADDPKVGGLPVSIDGLSEQEFVSNLLLTHKAPSGAYWLGLEKAPVAGEYVRSSNAHKPSFLHWAPTQPENNDGREAFASIVWNGPTGPASLRAVNGFCDLPLKVYLDGAPHVTTEVVEAGFVVESVGKHKGAVPTVVTPTSVPDASSSSDGSVSSVTLPPAAFLFPLGVCIAAYASRRMVKG